MLNVFISSIFRSLFDIFICEEIKKLFVMD